MQNGVVTLGPSSSKNNLGILLSSVFLKVLLKDLFSRGTLLVKAAYQNCIAFLHAYGFNTQNPSLCLNPKCMFPKQHK